MLMLIATTESIIFILNPKHSTIPTTRKKLNSIPAETRTQAFWVPVLLWVGPWFAEVLSSVRDARERELVHQGAGVFDFLSFSGTTSP